MKIVSYRISLGTGQVHVDMPDTAKVLDIVHEQDISAVSIMTVQNGDVRRIKRIFHTVGEGNIIPWNSNYIGKYMLDDRAHLVFEVDHQ